jgi:hypothetical protein
MGVEEREGTVEGVDICVVGNKGRNILEVERREVWPVRSRVAEKGRRESLIEKETAPNMFGRQETVQAQRGNGHSVQAPRGRGNRT